MTAEPHYSAADLPAEILAEIRSGHEVIIDESGEAVAKLIPLRRTRVRTPGLWKGKVELADDWDSPEVNEEIARDFGMSP